MSCSPAALAPVVCVEIAVSAFTHGSAALAPATPAFVSAHVGVAAPHG
jgi:hypothetical protein